YIPRASPLPRSSVLDWRKYTRVADLCRQPWVRVTYATAILKGLCRTFAPISASEGSHDVAVAQPDLSPRRLLNQRPKAVSAGTRHTRRHAQVPGEDQQRARLPMPRSGRRGRSCTRPGSPLEDAVG